MEMPELIKTIRSQLGLSQKSFAKAIHVTFATVNRWENNRSTPHSMARALIVEYCEKNSVDKALIDAVRSKDYD